MEKCIIIYDCSEELSCGSSPDKIAYPFTDKELADKFIKAWHNNNSNLEKCKDEEHKYYGHKDWVYWLEIDNEGVLNQLLSNVYPD